jgi:hypothetical protein
MALEQPAKERNFCERCGKRLGGANHIHTCTPPQPDDEHDELFCWKVQGLSDEYTGYMAEEEAKAVAKRIGGACFAFPLYVKPQPAREWVGLTDDEIKHEWEVWRASLPRYAGFARGLEAKLKEKNT